MKMKTTLLTIAMLTVAGNITAGNNQVMNMIMQKHGPVPADMLPSPDMRTDAGSFYKQIESLTVKDGKRIQPPVKGAPIQLSADLISQLGDTFAIAQDMAKDGDTIEQLHMAYAQIQYPYPGITNELTKLMGGNSDFMTALTAYGKAIQVHQTLWQQLWQDISTRSDSGMNISTFYLDISNGNKTAAQNDLKQIMTPVTVTAKQQAAAEKDLQTLLASSTGLKNQLTSLQAMFIKANKELGAHLEKIDYLVKQDIRWLFALQSAINPNFLTSITEETANTLTTTLTNLHTHPSVVAYKTQQATAHVAKTIMKQ